MRPVFRQSRPSVPDPRMQCATRVPEVRFAPQRALIFRGAANGRQFGIPGSFHMKHVDRVTAAVAVTCALLAAGCASTRASSTASAFQPGKYRHGDTVAIFHVDGIFVGTTTAGDDWVKGTYELSGNTFAMQDTWESASLRQQMGKDCIGMVGRYSWTLAGDVLTATATAIPARDVGGARMAWRGRACGRRAHAPRSAVSGASGGRSSRRKRLTGHPVSRACQAAQQGATNCRAADTWRQV